MKQNEKIALLLLTLCALLLMATRNLPWRLDDYDQAKQAYAALDVVQNGHWLFQNLPYGGFATKPPLTTWLQVAAYHVTGGNWEVAWRLPSFLAAAALLALLMRTALPLGGFLPCALALAAFAFNMLTIRIATLVRTDMLLALLCFAAGCKVFEHVRQERPWRARDQFIMFLLLLAAVFTKGHAVYAFFLPGLLLYSLIMRRARRPNLAWCGWIPLLLPLLILGGIVAWTAMTSPEFHEQIWQGEIMAVFNAGPVKTRTQPVYYYLTHLIHKWAPWSLFLLALLWREGRRLKTPASDPALLWLVCWTLGGLLVMSLVPQKRVDRIYPLLPALCLLLVWLVARWKHPAILRVQFRRMVTLLLMLGTFLWTLYGVSQVRHDARNRMDRLKRFSARIRQWDAPLLVPPLAEGFACYLETTAFSTPAEALERWQEQPGLLMLVEQAFLDNHREALGDFISLDSVSDPDTKYDHTYLLIGRIEETP